MNDKERIEYFMSEIARLSNQVVDLQNERDALTAQVAAFKERSSELYKLCDELIDHLRYNKAERDEVLNEFWNKQEAIKHVPSDSQQCLAEIKAEAVKDFVMFLPSYAYDINVKLEKEANQYAAKIRNGEIK